MNTQFLSNAAANYIKARSDWVAAFECFNQSEPGSEMSFAAHANMQRLEAQMLGIADVIAEQLTSSAFSPARSPEFDHPWISM